MPDFGSPVAANINVDPNKGLTTLSNLMGLQQQKQQIQSGALTIQRQQAELPGVQAETQAKQQAMAERQGIAKMLQTGVDPQGNSIRDPATGEIDPTKATLALGRNFSLTGQDYAQKIWQTNNARVGLQSAALTLDASQRQMLQGPMQALALNPSDDNIAKAKSTISQLVSQHPEMAVTAKHAMSLMDTIQGVQDPQHRTQLANGLAAMLQPGQAVQTQPQPTTVNTGAAQKQGTTAPPVAGGGFTPSSSVANEVGPGVMTFTDQAGNTWATSPQSPGHAIMVGHGGKLPSQALASTAITSASAPASPAAPAEPYWSASKRIAAVDAFSEANKKYMASLGDSAISPEAKDELYTKMQQAREVMDQALQKPDETPLHKTQALTPSARPSSGGPPVLTLGEADQVKANVDTVNRNRSTAADAQTQHDILQRIQTLAGTPGLYLGPGSRNVADLATMVAKIPGMEGAAKYANNYNELVKFMAQNAARQGASLGLSGSDARLDMAVHANPNADPMDARTVQHVAQYLGGIVRMNLAKADAMDHWLQQPGHSLQNEHQFEQQWRDNADPRLFQMAEIKDQGSAHDYVSQHIRKSESEAMKKKLQWLHSVGALEK